MPQTQVLQIDRQHPEPDRIARAAAILRAGGLVAFPTETVYGLGADALNAGAVQGIFDAKGRPANNPLIVHVADVAAARELVTDWPAAAERLVERFWPGPLSLVLPKTTLVPDIVTAGAKTVALRMPAHPVALELLRAGATPLAAPSANRSSEVSPTRAQHVLKGLQGRIDLLLDGGPTSGGLESTVLDLTSDPPRLLRPGLVSRSEIEAVIGPILWTEVAAVESSSQPLASPGLLSRHYAPRAALELIIGSGRTRVEQLRQAGLRIGWLALEDPGHVGNDVVLIRMPRDPLAYSAQVYAALHALDDAGMERIVVELPPEIDEWLAIRDRLHRAAAAE
jgi:L-threonylcarbamoyladenylate synthase